MVSSPNKMSISSVLPVGCYYTVSEFICSNYNLFEFIVKLTYIYLRFYWIWMLYFLLYWIEIWVWSSKRYSRLLYRWFTTSEDSWLLRLCIPSCNISFNISTVAPSPTTISVIDRFECFYTTRHLLVICNVLTILSNSLNTFGPFLPRLSWLAKNRTTDLQFLNIEFLSCAETHAGLLQTSRRLSFVKFVIDLVQFGGLFLVATLLMRPLCMRVKHFTNTLHTFPEFFQVSIHWRRQATAHCMSLQRSGITPVILLR